MATLDGQPATPAQLEVLADSNYGHYTSMRGSPAGVRGLSHHLARLARDSRRLFGADLDLDRVRAHIASAVAAEHPEKDYGLRVTVYDPALRIGQPSEATDPHVLISVRPTPPPPLPAPPLRAQVRPYLRDHPAVKHVGLFGAMHERRAAQLAGFDDVLFCAEDETLIEGATWNVGFIDGTDVIWPDGDCLSGVTMTLLRQVHETSIIRPIKTSELTDMSAAFATNVTVGVRAISQISDVTYPEDHPVLSELRTEFAEIPPEPLVSSG